MPPFYRTVLAGVLYCATLSDAVCSPASISQSNTSWIFRTETGSHPSCSSSAGGTNDLGTTPHMCEGDPTSVRIETTPGKAECLVARASQCKIPMHDFQSLDYDFTINGCNGVWAAPLWMTPDVWQWGPGSGEIDSLEFCTRDTIHLNFAGGGHQVNRTDLSIDAADGHVTVRKDAAGIVTITACDTEDAASDAKGQCAAPVYSNCADCQAEHNTFGCWCNEASNPPNIYGSGGCRAGGDCMWTLVSDIWNGVTGDGGYQSCMTAVPAIGLEKGKPNLKSSCAFSVEKLVLRGSGPDESLQFGAGSPKECAVLTTATASV